MSEVKQEKKQSGLVAWFAKNHVLVNMLLFFFIGGGGFAAFTMRAETFPSIDPKMILVTVPYPGATPYEVEDAITSRIEEAVIGIDGIKRVTSTATENAGTVQIEMEDFADAFEVRNDVETEIDRLIDFPPIDAEEPVIVKLKPTPSVLTLILYGEVPENELKYWALRIEEELLRVAKVSLVQVQGLRNYEISVEISEYNLRRYNLTIAEIGERIAEFSTNIPAGTLESQSGDIFLKIQEKGETAETFKDIVIRYDADGKLLRLGDIASVTDSFEDISLINEYNGKPAAFIQIARSEAVDSLEIEKAALAYFTELKLPKGLDLEIWESQTDILKSRINLLVRNAILGFALVFFVLLLFLDLKLAFWTSMGIPVSFLGGILVIFFLGLSLNMITLFALIVVLGIVVDDAIVVGESIFSKQESGEKKEEAAVDGVFDVRAPVIIGVSTTIAAFVPLLFVTGTLGQILRYIPIVVISILSVSLFEAFFILPAHLSSSGRWSKGALLKISDVFSRLLESFNIRFMYPCLKLVLRFRYASLAVFVGIIIIVFGMFKGGLIRFVFFPEIEGDEIKVGLVMPVGTSFDVTKDAAERIVKATNELIISVGKENFQGVLLTIGASYSQASVVTSAETQTASHLAEFRIRLVDPSKRTVSASAIKERLRKKVGTIPGAEELTYESGLIQAGADITVQLAHSDEYVLQIVTDQLKDKMSRMEGVVGIVDNLKPGKREYVFELKPEGLSLGLTPADIGRAIRNRFYGYEVQRIQRGRTELKVMVRYPEETREQLNSLYQMRIKLPAGGEVPLTTIASIREQGFASIFRADGQRVATVTADTISSLTTPNEAIEVIFGQIVPDLKKRFPDISVSLQGESRDRQEDLAALGKNMIIALILIFVILGALLQSYIQPLIIMSVIPFGIVGAFFGHFLLGYDLSFISLFGIVALAGVVINDSVILIDYFNRLVKEGQGVMDSMIHSVQRRFRPILFTTMTTCFGLLPMLLETSLQARFLIPMAISLAFGILFGTFILLFLVPVLILIWEDLGRFLRIRH